ncbi:citrate/2-methylcitrate synthase, partial [Klebsiella michiganensis]|uniref:citrate/2-methylcitrate synthase n=1 Tax=Klebsiella michiganensis TaxID=1134687 RepID=UPI002B1CBEEA
FQHAADKAAEEARFRTIDLLHVSALGVQALRVAIPALIVSLFAIPAEPYQLNPVIEQAMNQILVLHADHGQCASTTTVRAAG